MAKTKTVKTTLGDLIVALTEEATRLVPNKREAYKIVAFALRDLFYPPSQNAPDSSRGMNAKRVSPKLRHQYGE